MAEFLQINNNELSGKYLVIDPAFASQISGYTSSDGLNRIEPMQDKSGRWVTDLSNLYTFSELFVGINLQIVSLTTDDFLTAADFDKMDLNGDGIVSPEEKTSFMQSVKNWFSNLW